MIDSEGSDLGHSAACLGVCGVVERQLNWRK